MTIDLILIAFMLGILASAIIIVFRNTDVTFLLFRVLLFLDVILALSSFARSVIRILAGQLHSSSEITVTAFSLLVSIGVLSYVTFGITQGGKISR